MKLKHLCIFALLGIGLAACHKDEEEGNNLAGTCWEGTYLIRLHDSELTETTHTGFLSFHFAEDGKSCSVITSAIGLLSSNLIKLYTTYLPEMHSVTLRASSEESAETKYHGIIEGNCMEVSQYTDNGLEKIKLFRQQ